MKSKEELTSEDKKRSRSARKRKQKVTENIVNTVSDKRIKQGTISGESSSKITDFSKSSTFFAKLQDSVKDGIDKNNYSVKERLGKSTESAYSLKL